MSTWCHQYHQVCTIVVANRFGSILNINNTHSALLMKTVSTGIYASTIKVTKTFSTVKTYSSAYVTTVNDLPQYESLSVPTAVYYILGNKYTMCNHNYFKFTLCTDLVFVLIINPHA